MTRPGWSSVLTWEFSRVLVTTRGGHDRSTTQKRDEAAPETVLLGFGGHRVEDGMVRGGSKQGTLHSSCCLMGPHAHPFWVMHRHGSSVCNSMKDTREGRVRASPSFFGEVGRTVNRRTSRRRNHLVEGRGAVGLSLPSQPSLLPEPNSVDTQTDS